MKNNVSQGNGGEANGQSIFWYRSKVYRCRIFKRTSGARPEKYFEVWDTQSMPQTELPPDCVMVGDPLTGMNRPELVAQVKSYLGRELKIADLTQVQVWGGVTGPWPILNRM